MPTVPTTPAANGLAAAERVVIAIDSVRVFADYLGEVLAGDRQAVAFVSIVVAALDGLERYLDDEELLAAPTTAADIGRLADLIAAARGRFGAGQ